MLWVLASTVGWVTVGQGSYDGTSMWHVPLSGVVVAILQSLLLRAVAGVRWWSPWLIASLVPWLIVAGLFVVVPWATLTEGQSELTFFSSLLLTGVALGVGQWLVLRRHMHLAALWIIVPLISIVVATIASLRVNVALLARPGMIAWLGEWQEAHMLIAMVLGATDGIVTGTILLGLMSLRVVGGSQRLA